MNLRVLKVLRRFEAVDQSFADLLRVSKDERTVVEIEEVILYP